MLLGRRGLVRHLQAAHVHDLLFRAQPNGGGLRVLHLDFETPARADVLFLRHGRSAVHDPGDDHLRVVRSFEFQRHFVIARAGQMDLAEIRARVDGFVYHQMVEFHPTQQCFRVRMRVSRDSEETRTFAYGGMTRFLDRFFGKTLHVRRPRGAPVPTTPPGGRAGGTEFHAMCEEYMKISRSDPRQAAGLERRLCGQSAKFARFAAYVRTKGYVPLAHEYAICDPEMGYATAIDAVFADPAARRVVVVELKTGYRGVFEQTRGAVGAPLNQLFAGVSAKNRALAQVYLPAMLLRLHGGLAGWRVEAQVWQVNDDGVRVYILEGLCMQAAFVRDLRRELLECNRMYACAEANAHPLHKKNNRRKNK